MVTLIKKSSWDTLDDPQPLVSEKVWGTAYRIASRVAEVRNYLDIREINGYVVSQIDFYPASGAPSIRALVYIGYPDNPHFIGPQEPQVLAQTIYNSLGCCGPNSEYLFQLEAALDNLSPESGDAHVKDLAIRVRDLQSRKRQGDTS